MRNVAKIKFKYHFLIFEGCNLYILPAKYKLSILMYTGISVGPEPPKKEEENFTYFNGLYVSIPKDICRYISSWL